MDIPPICCYTGPGHEAWWLGRGSLKRTLNHIINAYAPKYAKNMPKCANFWCILPHISGWNTLVNVPDYVSTDVFRLSLLHLMFSRESKMFFSMKFNMTLLLSLATWRIRWDLMTMKAEGLLCLRAGIDSIAQFGSWLVHTRKQLLLLINKFYRHQ